MVKGLPNYTTYHGHPGLFSTELRLTYGTGNNSVIVAMPGFTTSKRSICSSVWVTQPFEIHFQSH